MILCYLCFIYYSIITTIIFMTVLWFFNWMCDRAYVLVCVFYLFILFIYFNFIFVLIIHFLLSNLAKNWCITNLHRKCGPVSNITFEEFMSVNCTLFIYGHSHGHVSIINTWPACRTTLNMPHPLVTHLHAQWRHISRPMYHDLNNVVKKNIA